MSRILLHGDPHLKISNFDLSRQFLDWFFNLVKQQDPDIVLNLGDTLDSHSIIRAEVLSLLVEHISSITDAGYTYIQLLGNHEFNKPTDKTFHALKALKGRKNHIIVDERLDLDGITYLPYFPNPKDFPLDTGRIVFCHQTFLGADYGYTKPEEGVEPNHCKADLIVSGHIHLRQEFDKVVYPGSPFAQNANDVGQIKGAFLFDTETFKWTFFECPLPKWLALEFILDNDFSIQELHTALESRLDDQNYWVVTISGPKASLSQYFSSKLYKTLAKGKHIKLNTTFTDKHKKLGTIKATSTLQVALDYASTIYKGSINKDILDKAIREVVETADLK